MPAPPLPAGTGQITVELGGFRNDRGLVIVSLFASARGFPEKTRQAVSNRTAPVTGRRAQVVFTDVPYGAYAISILHDENGNGEMDRNLLGIPREGHGASNNPATRFGPPDFAAARFRLLAPELSMRIRVQYFQRKK